MVTVTQSAVKQILFVFSFFIVLTAAGADGKINVTASNFPPFDFVRQIAKDRVNLSMLLPPGAESHSFEPSPRDIITIQNSDVFIYIGGAFQPWVERILSSFHTNIRNNIRTFAITDAVLLVEEEIVEGMQVESGRSGGSLWERFISWITGRSGRGNDHREIEYDEHVWTSPKNVIPIVRSITDILCEADPANAAFFRQNAVSFINELSALDVSFTELIANAKRKTIVFGDRFPFRYFADDYGLAYFAAFPGCSTESEPSAATVAFLINKIRVERIPVVFHLELSNERMADTISAETGARKLLLHSCHNISRLDFQAGLGYLDFMNRNLAALREALY